MREDGGRGRGYGLGKGNWEKGEERKGTVVGREKEVEEGDRKGRRGCRGRRGEEEWEETEKRGRDMV